MKSTNRTTSDIRAAGRQIRAAFIELGRASYRGVAERIGRSKSCLHRHEQARRRRNQYAESALWESPAGEAWLQTLFFATLYVFGLQGHVGADRLEEFFRLLRLETHIGISATTLRRRLNQMEALLPQFQAQCEQQAGDSTRPGVVAADETFQGKLLILVLMELRSGYLVLEDMADDRKFDTWQAVIEPRLKTLGLKVEHAVTDRARALIKLAKTGLKCGSGADLFHAQYDCSSWLGAKLARLQKKAATGLQQALAARQQASPATDTETLVALVDAERAHKAIQATGTEYHEQLAGSWTKASLKRRQT